LKKIKIKKKIKEKKIQKSPQIPVPSELYAILRVRNRKKTKKISHKHHFKNGKKQKTLKFQKIKKTTVSRT